MYKPSVVTFEWHWMVKEETYLFNYVYDTYITKFLVSLNHVRNYRFTYHEHLELHSEILEELYELLHLHCLGLTVLIQMSKLFCYR